MRGRRGAPERQDQLLDFARRMRREPTDAERKMWLALRGRRFAGFKFRRQVPIGPYIADFACLSRRLVVELDGGQHADSRRDPLRDLWLAGKGFRVHRVWNTEFLTRPGDVLDGIWHALEEQAAGGVLPSSALRAPSPRGGEGGLADAGEGSSGRGVTTSETATSETASSPSAAPPSPRRGEGAPKGRMRGRGGWGERREADTEREQSS